MVDIVERLKGFLGNYKVMDKKNQIPTTKRLCGNGKFS